MIRTTLCLVLAALTTATAVAAQTRPAAPADSLDLVIAGGRIVDGTGRPGFLGEVGIRGGWIVRVGPAGSLRRVPARQRVNATGQVISPGFVDVHSHTVDAILGAERRWNEGVVRQGVTTVLGGPDGGYAPEMMHRVIRSLAAQGAGTNVALYVGHNGVRRAVMANAQRAPTPDELERMKALVKEGMELGAVGLSSGLMYEPGMFSTTDEVVELAKVVAPYRGGYDSHVRDPVKRFLWSDQECIEIGERAGVAPKIGHEKAVGLENAGKIWDVIAMVNAARARGLDAVTDQYPYDGAATSNLDNIVVLPKDLRGQSAFDLKAALRDPAVRARFKEASENGVDGGFAWLKATGYTSMRITTSPEQPALVGKYLSELATERRLDPFDLLAELLLGATKPIGITLGAIKEADVRALMVQPWNMIASDGGYVDAKTSTMGHPRSTGTFPRVLGHYVREVKLLTLEEAVRKMTSLPADWSGLRDRGRIQEGQAADIAIFDPRTVADRSTWSEPSLMSVGVRDVLVGGEFVLRGGEMTGRSPGRYLRARR
ncbi:MAG: amidohydrolase family protein [Gemmatimonadetes bacterium]|nr:amidohydrolase family protein [Gemmatimonadota bacterium]